jgi:hypothetical protein
MRPLKVLFVSDLPDTDRGTHYFTGFLDELGHHLGQPVPVGPGQLRDVELPFDFVILETTDVEQSLVGRDASEQADLARRLVVVCPHRRKAFVYPQMVRRCLAGALESLAMISQGSVDPANQRTKGLTGMRDLAARINATCMDDLLMPPIGYCFMESTKHHGLPHLLADYLRALAAREEERSGRHSDE